MLKSLNLWLYDMPTFPDFKKKLIFIYYLASSLLLLAYFALATSFHMAMVTEGINPSRTYDKMVVKA